MAPTIFIVPGLWEGSAAFAPLEDSLRGRQLKTFTTSLKSTGTKTPGNPTLADDVAAIRADLERVVEEAGEEGVVAVCHSAGGYLGPSAMKGLVAPDRKEQGQPGGVSKIVFLAGGIAPEGHSQFAGPFMTEDGDGTARPIDSKNDLFHDLTPEAVEEWNSKVQTHPEMDSWQSPLVYCGWRHIPSVYIVCELDRLLPTQLQEQMAGLVGSQVVKIKAGHMAQLSATEEVAKIIQEAAQS
ncbi:Alpha/beta hydrolase fold-1 [Xylariales sp. PMI_506]|nr:Alpha/beta hydrolase fold-1 [Xylariales sp. PMI_506]